MTCLLYTSGRISACFGRMCQRNGNGESGGPDLAGNDFGMRGGIPDRIPQRNHHSKMQDSGIDYDAGNDVYGTRYRLYSNRRGSYLSSAGCISDHRTAGCSGYPQGYPYLYRAGGSGTYFPEEDNRGAFHLCLSLIHIFNEVTCRKAFVKASSLVYPQENAIFRIR